MPRPQDALVWGCGSEPSMDISLKSGFKEPKHYHCSFTICQTVFCAWYLLLRKLVCSWQPWKKMMDAKISLKSSECHTQRHPTSLPVATQTSLSARKKKKTDFPPWTQPYSPARNCWSRCSEMETSYSIQLPTHRSIVRLAPNVTSLGSGLQGRPLCLWKLPPAIGTMDS